MNYGCVTATFLMFYLMGGKLKRKHVNPFERRNKAKEIGNACTQATFFGQNSLRVSVFTSNGDTFLSRQVMAIIYPTIVFYRVLPPERRYLKLSKNWSINYNNRKL